MNERKSIKLLVVDDQESFFELIEEWMHMHNYLFDDIKCAYCDGDSDVIGRLKEWEPTVLVLNVHSPGCDAIDVLKFCKESLIEVVVVSASHSTEIEKSMLSHGAGHYMCKSESPNELERLISAICEIAPEMGDIH